MLSSFLFVTAICLITASLVSAAPLRRTENTLRDVGSSSAPTTAWTFRTYVPIYSSPVFFRNLVIFGSTDTNVYALHQATGDKVWSFATNDRVESSPCVCEEFGGIVFIGSTDKNFYALNATTGTLLWKVPQTNKNSVSTCVYRRGVVYWSSYRGSLYRAEAVSGKLIYYFENARGSPCVERDGHRVYIGQGTGYVSAYYGNLQLWQYSGSTEDFGSCSIRYGQVYINEADGTLYAIDSISGSLKWSVKACSTLDTTLLVNAPAADEGIVVIGNKNGNIYALNEATGSQHWSHSTSTTELSAPVSIGGKTYIGGADGGLRIFDTLSGTQLTGFTGDGSILPGHSAAIANGFVFFGTQNGTLYCLSYGGAGPTPAPPTLVPQLPTAPPNSQTIHIQSCANTSCTACTSRTFTNGCEKTSTTTSLFRSCSTDGSIMTVERFVASATCTGTDKVVQRYSKSTCYEDLSGSFMVESC